MPNDPIPIQPAVNLEGLIDPSRNPLYIPELLLGVDEHINDQCALSSLAATSRFHSTLNQPRITGQLLLHTAHGNQEMVNKLVSISPAHIRYLIARGTLVDYWGREFSNLSPFQYALWATDWHMWKMMLASVQASYAAGYEGAEEIRATLLFQYDEVRTSGLNYRLNGLTIKNEAHFDFTPLISSLKTYMDHADTWTLPQRREHWCHVIGVNQRAAPAHVVHEYCRPDRSFYPRPLFTENALPRGVSFNGITTSNESQWWSTRSVPMEEHFGVWRCSEGAAWRSYGERIMRGRWIDWEAISALSRVRAQQVIELRQQLSAPLKDAEFAESIMTLTHPY